MRAAAGTALILVGELDDAEVLPRRDVGWDTVEEYLARLVIREDLGEHGFGSGCRIPLFLNDGVGCICNHLRQLVLHCIVHHSNVLYIGTDREVIALPWDKLGLANTSHSDVEEVAGRVIARIYLPLFTINLKGNFLTRFKALPLLLLLLFNITYLRE
jgi:hypothetical protein